MMNNSQAVISRKRRVLVLLDSTTATTMSERVSALERNGAIIKIVDYRHLLSQVEEIRQILNKHQIDFVLFSRNDQVFDKVSIGPLIRALRVGYSSFSGIDSAHALEQARVCLDDYLAGENKLALMDRTCTPSVTNGQAGTFSLIFDLEQLGGARFGLSRILNLLNQYGAKATFFVTNYIQEVYSNALDIILRSGHEVGLHGHCHEYLSGQPLKQQIAMIHRMKQDFKIAERISGANFIYRMDANTVNAMITNEIDYFVAYKEHIYSPFAYRKMPLQPQLIWSPQGAIWMVPVSVETCNRPWFAVKNMINSALIAGRTEGWHHFNILLHPFRDGSLSHIDDLERLLIYMQGKHGYRAIPIANVIRKLPNYEPSNFIYYGFNIAYRKPVNKRFWQTWWCHELRYEQRISRLYQTLTRNKFKPALCLSLPDRGIVYCVYPCLPERGTKMYAIEDDPLLFNQHTQNIYFDFAGTNDRELSIYSFLPNNYRKDFLNAVNTLRPRFRQDYTGMLPEVGLRLAYRFSKGRHLF